MNSDGTYSVKSLYSVLHVGSTLLLALVQKIIFAGILFFSHTVHNFMAPVEKIQLTQQKNRLCVNEFTQTVYVTQPLV